jgi:hypothetical protein
MLDNLLRSGVEFGQLPAALARLGALIEGRERALEQIARELDLSEVVAPWLDAEARTRALLRTMADAASS